MADGIENAANNIPATIFPNPFTNSITVNLNNAEPVQLLFYDVTLHPVLVQTITSNSVIPTTSLAQGFYLYEVRNKNGDVVKGKLVKE